MLSTLAVCLEELSFKKYTKVSDLLILMAASFLENFGYRQMTAYWRFKGFMEYLFGNRSWGKMEKKGFDKKKEKEQIQKIKAELEDELV